ELVAVGHDETEVTDVRLVRPRIVDLGEDAVTERVPDTARGAQRRAHARFRARCPSWRNARPSRRLRMARRAHGATACRKARAYRGPATHTPTADPAIDNALTANAAA